MKKFELFMANLGNGTTICDKAVDYRIIGHIAECGKITWYVNPANYVPDDALLKIEHCANAHYENWKNWLNSIPQERQYGILLDKVPANIMLYAMNLDGDLTQKIEYLKNVCYEKSYF